MNETGGLSLPNILLVEDDAILAQAYLEFLRDEPCVTSHRMTVASAIDAIGTEQPEVVLGLLTGSQEVVAVLFRDLVGLQQAPSFQSDRIRRIRH